MQLESLRLYPTTDERIKNLSNVLILNIKMINILFPTDSVNSLINESSQQSNCVRIYCDMTNNNKCQIYFIKKWEQSLLPIINS